MAAGNHATADHVINANLGACQETDTETDLAATPGPDLAVGGEVTPGLTRERNEAGLVRGGAGGAHAVQITGEGANLGAGQGVDLGANRGRLSDVLLPEKCTGNPANPGLLLPGATRSQGTPVLLTQDLETRTATPAGGVESLITTLIATLIGAGRSLGTHTPILLDKTTKVVADRTDSLTTEV